MVINQKINLSIIALQGTIFNGAVSSVTLPGALGSFQVLTNHAPALSRLIAGKITYTIEDKYHSISVKSGLSSIVDNQIVVLCAPTDKTI